MRWLTFTLAFLLVAPFVEGQDTAPVRLADGFQLPVGENGSGKGYYRARGMRPNGHLGEDWDGVGGGDTDLGDPVWVTASGVVLYARDFHLGWGNVVIVRHAYLEGGQTMFVDSLYGHLNDILVQEGQQVTRGQKIGTIGTAHGQYAAHLHFEMRKNLRIGMARSAFARDYSNYWDPSEFIAAHPRLEGGDRIASVPINTFVKYSGPSDLDSAIAEAGGAPPRTSALTSGSPLTPLPTPKPHMPFKIDRFEDMRGGKY